MRRLIILVAIVLCGCAATIKEFDATGKQTTEVKVPFMYQYDVQSKTLRSDEHLVDASKTVVIELAKSAPDVVARVGTAYAEKAAEKAAEPEAQK